MAKILIVIAPEIFQEIEYNTPKKYLESKGHEIKTASTVENPISHMGNRVKVDLFLKDAKESDFDSVIFVGGGGSVFYFNHKPALNLAKEFYEKGKLTCAICAAPVILANAEILKNKKATCYPSQKANLIEKQAIYTGNPVEKDGNIITGNGPLATQAFAEKIHEALTAS